MKITAMLASFFLFVVLCFSNCLALSSLPFRKLQLPSNSTGPVSIAFDIYGGGPYTGISDGRIVKYRGPTDGFADFAFTSTNRTKGFCDGTTDPAKGPVCGRPLGIGFYYRTGQLYIADAYRGLMVVGTNGKLAIQLATSANGVPFRLPRDLDIDHTTGVVYFTDSSAVYSLGEIAEARRTGDATGRLLKYDPNSKQVTVLLSGLAFAVGASLSSDASFLLFGEARDSRILKYWLKGPKANTSEILIQFPDRGRPVNIQRTMLGEFWVAVNMMNGTVPAAIKFNNNGTELRRIILTEQYNTTNISEFEDRLGRVYIGSRFADFVGVIDSFLI